VFIPPIVFLMLLASWLESIFILPGHMALFPGKKTNGDLQEHWFSRIEDVYGRVLEKALNFKYIIIIGFIALLVFSGNLAKNHFKFVMFPNEETRDLVLTGAVRPGATRFETAQLVTPIEDIVAQYLDKEVVGFRTNIARSRRGGAVEENKFRMLIEIVPKEKRQKSADQIIDEFNVKFSKLSGFSKLKFRKSRWGQSSGTAIEIMVQQSNDADRDAIMVMLTKLLPSIDGVTGSEINEPPKNSEYRISLNREKVKRLSINPGTIATTLRAILDGKVLYTLLKDDKEVNVRLSATDSTKKNIHSVLETPVENNQKYLVPLRELVSVTEVQSRSSISRQGLKRTTVIDVDMAKDTKRTPLELAKDIESSIFPQILSKYPTTTLSFQGEVMDTIDSKRDLRNAVLVALVLMFFILVILFNSLVKPLRIMAIIPFGVIGIILAFFVHGKLLFGFYAAIGTLGMMGVVVNDAIVMLVKLDREYIKPNTKRGISFKVSQIAKTRLRAILLTTMTTVAGVMPTAYGLAGYDAMLAEMMLALAWGLIFGTVITLFLVPCLFQIEALIRFRFSKVQVAGPMALGLLFLCFLGSPVEAKTTYPKPISLETFIQKATINDQLFESILVDGLALSYKRALTLPPEDFIVSLKSDYEWQGSRTQNNPNGSIELSKLFPKRGLELSGDYAYSDSSGTNTSAVNVSFSQDLAKNAFGRSIQLQDQIVGLEIDIATYQVIESYEAYLAQLMTLYYTWVEQYRSWLLAEASYQENLKLLLSMESRKKNNIAHRTDVNKIRLQNLNKRETLILFRERYQRTLNQIRTAMRESSINKFVPIFEENKIDNLPSFSSDLATFKKTGRTFMIIRLLENSSALSVDRVADNLLPSLALTGGATLEGDGAGLSNSGGSFSLGIQYDFPLSSPQDQAAYDTAIVAAKKAKLNSQTTYFSLTTRVKNLYLALERQIKLIAIAEENIELAESILIDEAENYSFAKINLNDYIQAVNGVDNARFNKVERVVRYKKLLIEWKSLTDQLVKKSYSELADSI